MNNQNEKEEWFEYRVLCEKCHAVAVFHNVTVGQKLRCDAGHDLGVVPAKEAQEA